MGHNKWIEVARVNAQLSDYPKRGRRTSCIIVKKGRAISIGWNKHKNRLAVNKATVHAEVDALNKANGDASGGTAYIFRQNGGISKPCHYCLVALKKHDIRRIIYEDEYGAIQNTIV